MLKRIAMLGVIALAAIVVWPVVGQEAQRGERPQDRQGRGAAAQRGQRGQRGFLPPQVSPIVKALDKNKDGVISKEEIENAVAALNTLDKNKDGKLTREEYTSRPRSFADRLLEMDENKDGKLQAGELPEGFRARVMERLDTNQDGVLDKTELERMNRSRGGAPREGQGQGDRPRRPRRGDGEQPQ